MIEKLGERRGELAGTGKCVPLELFADVTRTAEGSGINTLLFGLRVGWFKWRPVSQ